eukprot:scaffold102656_cov48-Phaeocystis_antarctica.AAC.1
MPRSSRSVVEKQSGRSTRTCTPPRSSPSKEGPKSCSVRLALLSPAGEAARRRSSAAACGVGARLTKLGDACEMRRLSLYCDHPMASSPMPWMCPPAVT